MKHRMTSDGYLEWLGQKRAEGTLLFPSFNRRSGDSYSFLAPDITSDVTHSHSNPDQLTLQSPCQAHSLPYTRPSLVPMVKVSIRLETWQLTLGRMEGGNGAVRIGAHL